MEELRRLALEVAGIRLSKGQLAAFAAYERILLEWNARFNLTAIRDPQEVRTKHFLDSLTCLMAMRDKRMERVIDVGSGAGFPGMPLKIAWPSMHLALVESVGKKANFCRHLADELRLKGVEVLQIRAEEAGQLWECHQ